MTLKAVSETTQVPDYGRPRTIEELSNRWVIHPVSGVVERLAIEWGISANVISLMGLFSGLMAGLLYYYQDHHIYVLGGFLCMIVWHVFDGADGRVARATGTSSAFGRVLDGICDHLVFGAVYLAFMFYLLKTGSGPMVWLLGVGAAVSHGIQAAGYEERRQKFQRRLSGNERSNISSKLLDIEGRSSWLAKSYDFVQRLVSGRENHLDKVVAYNRQLNLPETATQAMILRTSRIVRAWALLNANNRTIMLAVFALIGKPALYFVYEISILNAVLLGLIFFEKAAEKQIASDATLGLYPAI